MATIVNNPPATESGGSLGTIAGIILLLLAVFVFLYYLIPILSNANRGTTVNVPERIDVNVQGQNAPQK